jgi:hypothetical protein
MAEDEVREARAELREPQDTIRSIYAARSAVSGMPSTGDFAGIKTADADQSLRSAYMSRLFKPKEEAPREGGRLSEDALRRAYIAHTIAGAGARR